MPTAHVATTHMATAAHVTAPAHMATTTAAMSV